MRNLMLPSDTFNRWGSVFIAVLFLFVGALSAYNTYTFTHYTQNALQRDAAQEDCNAKTVRVLKAWSRAMINVNDAQRQREFTAATILDYLKHKEPVPQEAWDAFADAIRDEQKADSDANQTYRELPFPQCGY